MGIVFIAVLLLGVGQSVEIAGQAAGKGVAALVETPKAVNASYSGKVFNAGGKWTFTVEEDKLTGATYGMLELKADEVIGDGIGSGYPSFVIMCGGSVKSPKWINSKLMSPVVLGRGDSDNGFGISQQRVYLRADDKIKIHRWNIADDFRTLFVDKGATKELLGSKTARIQFRDVSEHEQVAIFSPAGLDREHAAIACGEIVK